MPDNKFPINGSNQEKFVYVYEKAKEYGDPYPELVAAQFALESGYGTSENFKNLNNAFGQTEVGGTLQKRKWKKFDSVDSAIKYRVSKWGAKYKDQKNPISAMAKIQGSYAPSSDGNSTYMKSIAGILKENGFYNGDTNIPNADKKPEFYKERNNADFTIDKKVIEKKLDEFDKKIKDIKSSKEPNIVKSERIKKVQLEYQNKGYILPNTPDGKPQGFNLIIEERNKAKEEKLSFFEDIKKMTNGIRVDYQLKKDQNGKERQYLEKFSQSGESPYTPGSVDLTDEEFKELNKKYPNIIFKNRHYSEFNKNFHPFESERKYRINLDALNEKYSQLYEEATGKKGYSLFDISKNGNLIRGKNAVINRSINERFSNSPFGNRYAGSLTINEFPEINKNQSLRNPLGYIQDLEETTEEEVTDTEETTPVVDTTDATAKEIEAAKKSAEKKEVPTTLATDDFFRGKDEVPEPMYNKFKDNFPWAQVLGNAAGAFAGMAMADKKIPMRDEQVSDAFRNYAAELKKLSEIGLRPEEEAYAKRMITESYTGSIDQLVKASGGARNLVLGNLGRIDAQKNKSLIELAVADASAKTQALYKYGEAMQYINDFDARRDIANNERKYKNVLMTKEAGAELAQAGFAGLIDSLNEYRDNKPGSINHLRRSKFSMEHFGYDYQLKDDKTGTKKGTYSWMLKKYENLAKIATERNEVADIYWKLDDEGKKQLNDYMLKYNFENYKDFAKQIYQRQVDSENGDGIVLTPEQLADDSSGYADPNYVGTDGKKATKTSYSTVLNEADNGIKVNDNGIITSEKVSPSYLGDPRYDQEMLKKYPPEQAYQDILNKSKNGTLNGELPSEEEFTKDYIKQFEFAVDSKIRPAETKALETNPIDGNVYTGARAVLGEQENETPAQKLERLNREAEEYLKKDKSSNTLDLLINDTVKQTEELIKGTQK